MCNLVPPVQPGSAVSQEEPKQHGIDHRGDGDVGGKPVGAEHHYLSSAYPRVHLIGFKIVLDNSK